MKGIKLITSLICTNVSSGMLSAIEFIVSLSTLLRMLDRLPDALFRVVSKAFPGSARISLTESVKFKTFKTSGIAEIGSFQLTVRLASAIIAGPSPFGKLSIESLIDE